MTKQIKKLLVFCILVCVAPMAANAYVNRETAVVRIMDKAAGKVQEISMPVGQVLQVEKLSLIARTCKQTDPFQPEDFWAFVEVSMIGEGRVFSNWMSRNEPGDNPMQHADYDVWLVRCE